MKKTTLILALGVVLAWVTAAVAQPVRLKDLGRLAAVRENPLVGYGIVTGLAGTGDSSRSKVTRQTLANMLSNFDLVVSSDDIQSRNVAVVMITAALPGYARPGETLDVRVTSVGDARSLAGGVLLLTPLKGADGRTYALAQGALTMGGYRHDAAGNLQQKNHPTVALVSSGATVEVSVNEDPGNLPTEFTFLLNEPDYTTASRMADVINANLGAQVAQVRDANGLELTVPVQYSASPARFIRQLESLSVEPDRRARVVINERTGTVVSGGDVRISRVAIAHGDLKVSVQTDNAVSQPGLLIGNLPGVRSLPYSNTQVQVTEAERPQVLAPGPTTVSDLVQGLAKLKVSTRDMIAIMQAIKAAGALHGELLVQ